MKKSVFLAVLLVMTLTFNAMAFDWKPQSNEALRTDMIVFARDFAQDTQGTKAGRMLKRFVRRQERLAKKDEYAWISETHEMVDKLKKMFPAKIDDGDFESMMRRKTLQLLDYPLHSDNFAKTSPEGTAAFDKATQKYLYDARQSVLQWLDEPRPEDGQIDVALVYNMGVLLRTFDHTIAIDIRWDGTKEEAKRIAESIDVLFLTHPHDDHYSPVMLQAVVDAGKTVVLPCMLPDWENNQASILDSELIRPKEMGDFSISSLRGNQGEGIPNNVYLIEFNGWRILHQGDYAVWDLQEKLKDMPMADIIIAPSWNGIQWLLKPAMQAKKLRGREPLLLPVHNNEMCHSVDHRESYHELFNRQDRLGDPNFKYPRFVLIDNGDHVSLQH